MSEIDDVIWSAWIRTKIDKWTRLISLAWWRLKRIVAEVWVDTIIPLVISLAVMMALAVTLYGAALVVSLGWHAGAGS